MKTLISLDISSSTIGWAVFKYDHLNASLINYGHFKPPNKLQSKDCFPFRLEKAISFFKNLMILYPPNEVVIEDYAKSFSKGRSTANTIIVLSTFNEVMRLTAYQKMNKDVVKYPVTTIRSIIGKHFQEKIVSKDDIFPVIVKYFKTFNVKLNKKQNILSQSYDEADAIAVGLTHILKTEKGITNWNF